MGDISLNELPDRVQNVKEIANASNVHKDWLYAPQQQKTKLSSGIPTPPYSARTFELPKTHILTHKNADSIKHLEFIVWCISFFPWDAPYND